MGGAVRAAGAAGLGAGAERLLDNALDGARAAAALGTAAETAIDLLGIPGKVFRAIDRTADIVVGQDVAGTNDHKTMALLGDAGSLIDMQADAVTQREKPHFEAIPNCHR